MTDISAGPYDLIAKFTAHPSPVGELTYNYQDLPVTVSSGQTTNADFTLNPALIEGPVQIDWSQFGPLMPDDDPFNSQSSVVFGASATSAPPGSTQAAFNVWKQFDGVTGIHTYPFVLPIDPAKPWAFQGAFFTLFYQDGTFANITAIPGISSIDQVANVPPTTAGQVLHYDFTNLLAFGVGHVQFVPRSPAGVGGALNGYASESVPNQGVRYEYLHIFEFGNPAIAATSMQGQQTLTGTWYDASFNQYDVDLTPFDLRAKETVIVTESAPRLDNVQPLPGNICGGGQRITVTGTVSDPDGVAKVLLNGTPVPVSKKDGSFSAATEMPLGDGVLSVQAIDGLGNSITRQRPMHRDAACH
jgi:hypothetical protein